MADLACADCGHNVLLHDGQGCTVSSCDCTSPPPAYVKALLAPPAGRAMPADWSLRVGQLLDQLEAAIREDAHRWVASNWWRPEIIAADPDIDSCEMTFEEQVAWHGLRDQLRRMQ